MKVDPGRLRVAGLTRDEYERAAIEIRQAWERAGPSDVRAACLQVIVESGRKYGYKNVMAALQNRVPKQFERGTSVESWVDDRKREEAAE
jgi:hypothetical protein